MPRCLSAQVPRCPHVLREAEAEVAVQGVLDEKVGHMLVLKSFRGDERISVFLFCQIFFLYRRMLVIWTIVIFRPLKVEIHCSSVSIDDIRAKSISEQ